MTNRNRSIKADYFSIIQDRIWNKNYWIGLKFERRYLKYDKKTRDYKKNPAEFKKNQIYLEMEKRVTIKIKFLLWTK